jgi:hypothetical protein
VEQLAIMGRFKTFVEEQFCWFLETFQFLKGRSRVISLADYMWKSAWCWRPASDPACA